MRICPAPLAATLLLGAALFACAEESAPEPRPALKALVIEQGAVGPLTIGMDRDDAVRTGMVKETDGRCEDLIVSPYPRETIYYEFCRGKDDDLDGILVKAPGPHTAEGIEVGSRRRDVVKEYGSRLVEAPAQFAGGTLVLESKRGDVRFNFDGGRVFTIDVTRHRTPTFDGSG